MVVRGSVFGGHNIDHRGNHGGRGSVEGDFNDLSWTANEDWKFGFMEGLGLDVPRPERFEEVENPTES